MARHRSRPPAVLLLDPLTRRWRRLARKGEYRKAALAMRELIAQEGCARHWVQLGHLLLRAHRGSQALDAFKQGAFLHTRAGHPRKAKALLPFLEQALAA